MGAEMDGNGTNTATKVSKLAHDYHNSLQTIIRFLAHFLDFSADFPFRHHAYQNLRFNLQRQHRTKLCSILSRESVRLLTRHFRCIRDHPLRGRRLVREVANYWRRAERESYENRRRAEREEIELRKKMNEQKEVERQKKKLEFLLTQTELYSHFIGRKMGIVEEPTPSSSTTATAPNTDRSKSSSEAESELLAHAASIRNDDDSMTADEAARKYIAAQHAKMAEFDKLEAGRNGTPVVSNNSSATNVDDTRMTDASNGSPSSNPALSSADSLDLLNPSTMPQQESFVQAASSFCGNLKSYQLRGLNWLLNLYEQGINGILADEMGLGKTVQSIAFLSYLSSSKDCWGPFLIVAPNSTLHQWQQEVSKFVPSLKVLPYWGSTKERQILRQFWTSKQLYTKEAPFHVLITSYNVVVADEKYFHRMKFMYMILDEAQAIKNAASQRWKCLLNLKCRNRVLLTGTPIQNSMAELWALLHFIMPSLFESHEDFQEWFSKDVEDAAVASTGPPGELGGVTSLDHRQVQRLHMILKPFMLRRVKKDVENEMPPKIEVTLPCKLSATQMKIYKTLQKKIFASTQQQQQSNPSKSTKSTFLSNLTNSNSFSSTDSTASDSLVTLVMQFRKVCNHPELYEKKRVISPYYFGSTISYPVLKQKTGSGAGVAATGTQSATVDESNPALAHTHAGIMIVRCPAANHVPNPIAHTWPSLINQAIRVPVREKLLHHTFNIYTAQHVFHSLYHRDVAVSHSASTFFSSVFSFLPFIDMTPIELEFAVGAELFHRWFATLALQARRERRWMRHQHLPEREETMDDIQRNVARISSKLSLILPSKLAHLNADLELADQNPDTHLTLISSRRYSVPTFRTRFELYGDGLIWSDPSSFHHATSLLRRFRRCARSKVIAPPIRPLWTHSLASHQHRIDDPNENEYVGWEKSILLGMDAWKWSQFYGTRNRFGLTYPVSLNQSNDLMPIGLQALQRKIFTASPYTEKQATVMQLANEQVEANGKNDTQHNGDEPMNDDTNASSSTITKPVSFLSTSLPLPLYRHPSAPLQFQSRTLHSASLTASRPIPGLLTSIYPLSMPVARMLVPTMEDLIADSGKLQVLDQLLAQLKKEGHRVLIFSQMTKLIDLLENFLTYRKYKFSRLDGQTALSARRDLVRRFQHDSSIFAFLLSTRAGGLVSQS